MSRTEGISEAELDALADPSTSDWFNEKEKTALAYAAAIATSEVVEEPLFDEVRRHFSAEEIIELTATITWEICAAKFNRALEIDWGICPYRPRARAGSSS